MEGKSSSDVRGSPSGRAAPGGIERWISFELGRLDAGLTDELAAMALRAIEKFDRAFPFRDRRCSTSSDP